MKDEIDAATSWHWNNNFMWSIVAMFVMGAMARTFISDEPFDLKKFLGEMILAGIGAIMLYSLGLMQNMNEIQIIGFGASASLGGIRMLEWSIKVFNTVKGNPGDR